MDLRCVGLLGKCIGTAEQKVFSRKSDFLSFRSEIGPHLYLLIINDYPSLKPPYTSLKLPYHSLHLSSQTLNVTFAHFLFHFNLTRKIDTGTDLSLRAESDIVSLFYILDPNCFKRFLVHLISS